MSMIVLAAGLGVANFTFVALLFRRERQLSRQLSDMRAERNSEWILHALRDVPDEQERSAPAANGDFPPSAAGPQPVRRKKHLGLLLGGGSAAVLATVWRASRRTWQRNPSLVMAGAAGVATATTVAVVLTGAHSGSNPGPQPPPSPPTATATITAPRRPKRPSTTPATSPPAPRTTATTPTPSGPGRQSLVPPSATPGGDASSGGGLHPIRSAPGSARPPTAGPSGAPSPSTRRGAHAACLDADVESVLELAICLAGGG